ncbi:MAG: phasin family protein [Cyanobacteria bacterium J06641_5]
MDNDNWLRQLLVMGIGTTTLIAETLSEVSTQWVRDGKIDPEQARELVDELMGRLRSDAGEFEGQMERQLRNVMQDMGVARQTEVDELRGRVDRLERQVRDLENKLWRKRTSNETNLD